ncbi:MAG: hypothetical protein WED04_10175 [Promethearchaeati archaeon SRVP18_Atabeyarchaeia-1]
MTVHNVYVFSENGEPLVTMKLGSIEADSTLLTGFLSAMESFSKKIAQGDIEEINVKDFKFHIKANGHVYVALVADKGDQDAKWRLHEVCKIIEDHQNSFADKLVEMEIRDAVTKKISLRDRVASWAEVGL